MDKLKEIKKLEKLEVKINSIKDLLSDMRNIYLETAHFNVAINSKSYIRIYKGEKVSVNKNLFIKYLEGEIIESEKESKNIIDKLSNMWYDINSENHYFLYCWLLQVYQDWVPLHPCGIVIDSGNTNMWYFTNRN